MCIRDSGKGILVQPCGRPLLAALHRVAPQAQHRLRGEPEVGTYRDLPLDEEADDVEFVAGPFELDHLGAGLHQTLGRVQRSLRRGVGKEGQVRHQQGPGQPRRCLLYTSRCV